jgi:hypothetical protein
MALEGDDLDDALGGAPHLELDQPEIHGALGDDDQ